MWVWGLDYLFVWPLAGLGVFRKPVVIIIIIIIFLFGQNSGTEKTHFIFKQKGMK